MTSDEQRAAFREWFGRLPLCTVEEYDAWLGWQACAAQQAPQARADEPVRIALLNLAAEVGGLLSLHDAFLREIHGNTNINILGRRLDEADAALAAAPALVEGKK